MGLGELQGALSQPHELLFRRPDVRWDWLVPLLARRERDPHLEPRNSVYESAILYPTDASYLSETANTSNNQYPIALANGSVDFNRDRFVGDPPSGRVRATVADTLLNGQCGSGAQTKDVPPFGANLTAVTPAVINFPRSPVCLLDRD